MSLSTSLSPGIIVGANVVLLIGNLTDYWSFEGTMLCYLFEIAALVLFATLVSLWDSKMGSNFGVILVSGFMIVRLAFVLVMSISTEMGIEGDGFDRLENGNFTKKLIQLSPVFVIILFGLIKGYFELPKKERRLAVQTMLFHKIILILAILLIGSALTYFLHEYALTFVVLLVILARIGMEYYLYPETFKKKLKKNNSF